MTTADDQPAPTVSAARRRLREGLFLPAPPSEAASDRNARYDALELCAEDAEEFGCGGRRLSSHARQWIMDRVVRLEADERSGASAQRSQALRVANRARKRQRQRELYARSKHERP